MLVEFSVENFRSIRGNATLSMVAAKLRARDEQLDRTNVIEINDKLAVLRSAVIYGANASGKSNVLKAMGFMRHMVINSSRLQDGELIPVEPFRLNIASSQSPSTFEIVFLIEGTQYRYGFSLTQTRIVSEWLYFIPTLREVELFTRTDNEIHIGPRFSEGRGLKGLNLDNKLFLSVVDQFKKSHIAKLVRAWFINSCRTLTAVEDSGYLPYTINCIEEGRYREQLEQLVRRLDLDIVGLSVADIPLPAHLAQLQDALKNIVETNKRGNVQLSIPGLTAERIVKELRTKHSIRDDNGQVVDQMEFAADSMESEGTQKLIALTGPILDVLANGWTLFLDEIDSRLHPLITAAILRLFNSPITNPQNAQIICTTHDTNLLDRHLFRRDQVFFVEKDTESASHLYSLAEFKLPNQAGGSRSIRNDASFEKDYIQGRYGAIPYLGDLGRLFAEEFHHQKRDQNLETEPVKVSV